MPYSKLIDQVLPPLTDEADAQRWGDGVTLSRGPSISPGFAHAHRRFIPHPPNAAPSDLFEAKVNRCTMAGYRFIRKTDYNQMLIFTDGACSENGRPDAKAGCAVVLGPLQHGKPISMALEIDGQPHTSNRAELRAVILALRLRWWTGEGFKKIVIATDSEYVVEGMASWHKQWIANGWKNADGEPVANRDLWEKLLAKVNELESINGELVQFWRIPREWNEAEQYAKEAAQVR